MSMDQDFPVLDFQEFNQNFDKFSRDVFEASKKWGFFILTGSGISKDNMFGLVLHYPCYYCPQNWTDVAASRETSLIYPWRRSQLRSSTRQSPDMTAKQRRRKFMRSSLVRVSTHTMPRFAASEGMSFGLPAGGVLQSDNIPDWFDTPKRQAIEDFKSECYELSGALMSCFAVRLGLDKSYFKESHLQKAPGNTLKLIKYPRLEKTSNDIPRLSEHTDWGSITFVFTDRAGLEIRDPNNKWFHIPVVPEGIVVNIGDALSLWTDRGLKSTMHRITWTNLPLDKDRYSIAYFTNPNLGE